MTRAVALLLAFVVAGCSQAVQVVRDDGESGVVTYVYKEERGAMFSKHRAEALKLIKDKCPKGYAITREGEARTQQSVGGVIEGTEDSISHRWGMQYACRP